MKKFLLVFLEEPVSNEALAWKIEEAISDAGGVVFVRKMPLRGEVEFFEGDFDVDIVFSVGGDGTLIRTSKYVSGKNIPLLGVNRGHLGYLCELDEISVFPAIRRLLSGDYDIEERMLLSGELLDADGKVVESGLLALNDVVIRGKETLQVIRLSAVVDGELLYEKDGDGMILATPTGSTAYNLSANGPIVDPTTQMIIMTPINPHTLFSRSIVLDAGVHIEISLVPRRRLGDEPVAVCFDGGAGFSFFPGQVLKVEKSAQTAPFVRLTKMNFLERVRVKIQAE